MDLGFTVSLETQKMIIIVYVNHCSFRSICKVFFQTGRKFTKGCQFPYRRREPGGAVSGSDHGDQYHVKRRNGRRPGDELRDWFYLVTVCILQFHQYFSVPWKRWQENGNHGKTDWSSDGASAVQA